jgi:hypothetical protein
MRFKEEDLDWQMLGFGKYEGKCPAQIAEEDPAYIVWLYESGVQDPSRPDSPTGHIVSSALYHDCRNDVHDDDGPVSGGWINRF